MKRFALAALLLVATLAYAGKTTTSGYTCSLTGKKIAACCCKPTKDGKLSVVTPGPTKTVALEGANPAKEAWAV